MVQSLVHALQEHGRVQEERGDGMKYIGIYIAIVIALLLASFGFTALLVKCLCWAFGYTFSWKIAFGIWVLLGLVGGAFKSNVTVKK
jgi:hypothetical protein